MEHGHEDHLQTNDSIAKHQHRITNTMYHDGKAANRSDIMFIFFAENVREKIATVVHQVDALQGVLDEPQFYSTGSFNYCYTVTAGVGRVLFRFPILGRSAFRYEKTNDECAIMGYLLLHTSIPVPKVIRASATDIGPFLVLPLIEGKQLSSFLSISVDPTVPAALKPDISTSVLGKAYRDMADILIELSSCRFSKIGGVIRDECMNWLVGKRPVTMNMNVLVTCGNYPPEALPQDSFSTANEYFAALAEIHLTHLRTQRNDAVEDEADCRRKFVARCLFRRIAQSFSNATDNHGPFPLYCDDLRPSNVLVDSDLNVRSVIDWEYCYAAPVELTYSSPWWLLLNHPDDWEDDLDGFLDQYLPRHDLFLQMLQAAENERIRSGHLTVSQRLSPRMAESLRNGQFWFCRAVTSSYGFDDIYWRFIDRVYYGEFTSIDERIQLLTTQEQADLEPLVQLKMKQADEKTLDDHSASYNLFTA